MIFKPIPKLYNGCKQFCYISEATQLLLVMNEQRPDSFQHKQFAQILTSANIKQKLALFIKELKDKNISFVYKAIAIIRQALDESEAKFIILNALMATIFFIETLQYTAITLVQIYLLPRILQIAKFINSQSRVHKYFAQKGQEQNQETQQTQRKTVILAIQLLYIAAIVKPFRTLANFQLKQDSLFYKARIDLLQNGVGQPQVYTFFNKSQAYKMRKQYLINLAQFDAQQYISFFKKLICKELNNNIKPDLQSRELYLYGDPFLTVVLLDTCEQELLNMQTNFSNKIKYLELLDFFIRQGDIYAILIITKCQFLHQICQQILKTSLKFTTQQPTKIYYKIQASLTDKKLFYYSFLRYITIWANCHPCDSNGVQSQAYTVYKILNKNNNKILSSFKRQADNARFQMKANLRRNKIRNQRLIKAIQDDFFTYRVRKSVQYQYVTSTQKPIHQSHKQLDQISSVAIEAQTIFPLLTQRKNLSQNVTRLQKFKSICQRIIGQNHTKRQEKYHLQAYLCLKTIQIILSAYKLYKSGKIPFQNYQNTVKLVLKSQMDLKSVTSIQLKQYKQEQQQCQLNFLQQIDKNTSQIKRSFFTGCQYKKTETIQDDEQQKNEVGCDRLLKGSVDDSLFSQFSQKIQIGNQITRILKTQGASCLKNKCNLSKNIKKQQRQVKQDIHKGLKSLEPYVQSNTTNIHAFNYQPQEHKNSLQLKYHQQQLKFSQNQITSTFIRLPSQNPLVQSYHTNGDLVNPVNTNDIEFKKCLQVKNDLIASSQRMRKLRQCQKDGKLINIVDSPKSKRISSSIHDMFDQNKLIYKYRSLGKNTVQQIILCQNVSTLSLIDREKRIKLAIKKNSLQKTMKIKELLIVQKQKRFINWDNYLLYFTKAKQIRIKRAMLLSKSKILRNNQFQIGCISARKDDCVEISLFITPLKDSMQDINIEVSSSQGICVSTDSKNIKKISINYQERVIFICRLTNIPYALPVLNFSFKYSKDGYQHHLVILVPCSFNKFVSYQSIQKYPQDIIANKGSTLCIRTEKFRYNPSVMGEQKIKQSLNRFTFVGRSKNGSHYLCEAYYSTNKCLIQVILTQKEQMHLQAVIFSNQHTKVDCFQFLLATFRLIFEA